VNVFSTAKSGTARRWISILTILASLLCAAGAIRADSQPLSSKHPTLLGWRARLDDLLSLQAWRSQIYETNTGSGTVGKLDTSGKIIQRVLISGLNAPNGIAVSGPYLYIVNQGGTVAKYTTSGELVNKELIKGLNNPIGIAVSGSELYVANAFGNTIGKYTTNGDVINAAIITGLGRPIGIAVSGSDLFVTCAEGMVGKYTTSGTTVNPTIVDNIRAPWGIVISGSSFYFTTCEANGRIAQYTRAGKPVNENLVIGLDGPVALAITGDHLFVSNEYTGTISEYLTSGQRLNACVATGFRKMSPWGPYGLAVVGPRITVPITICLCFICVAAAVTLLGWRRYTVSYSSKQTANGRQR
jgi:hypothetical protein